MRRLSIIVSALVGLALVGLVVLYAALPRLSSSPALRRTILEFVRERVGWDVRIDSLRIGHDLVLHLEGVALALPEQEPFVTVVRLEMRAPWVRPGARGYVLGALVIDAPEVWVDRLPPSETAAPRREAEDAADRRTPTVGFSELSVKDLHGHATISGQSKDIGPVDVILADRDGDTLALTLSAVIDAAMPALEVEGSLTDPFSDARSGTLQVDWLQVPLAPLEGWVVTDAPAPISGIVDARFRVSFDAEGVHVDYGNGGDGGLVVQSLETTTAAGGLRIAKAVLSGSATQAGDGKVEVGLRIAVDGLAANDPQYLKLIDGVALRATAALRTSASGELQCDCALSFSAGEVLWDRFYADLGRLRPSLKGSVTAREGRYTVDRAQVSVKSLGDWKGSARLEPEAGHYRAEGDLDVVQLGQLLAIAVVDPFKESFPALADASAQGRLTTSATVTYDVGKGFTVFGRGKLHHGALAWPQPELRLGAVELDVPLAFGTGKVRGESRTGRIGIGSLDIAGVAFGEIAAKISVAANAVRLDESVSVDVFGGKVVVEGLVADRILDDARVNAALSVADIDLALLSAAFELPDVVGTAQGALDPIRYENGRIVSEGSINTRLLGGSVRLSNLGMSGLFSPVPAIELDMQLDDIDLKRLTAAIEVGRVSGVVSGTVTNLVLVKGEPVSMNAKIATKRTRSVPQTISVTALNQISILGGSDSNALSRGILGLFDRYNYKEMGFSSTLDNDRFTLHGIQRSAGKELLVVGSLLPPTVNIVSHSQVIAFSEMVRRLARVRETGTPTTREPQQK